MVNDDLYREMIRNFEIPKLSDNGMEEYWFQQDGVIGTVRSHGRES